MVESSRINAENPWPWLEPFVEEVSAFFHGRGGDVQGLLRCVHKTPVCLLFGKSGLGKTSLLLAGLFPLLRLRTMLPVVLRRFEFDGTSLTLSGQLLRALNQAAEHA